MLPVDHVVASEINAGAPSEVVESVPDGMMAVDIGPATIAEFSRVVAGAKTVIWNGPMGVFEKPPFDKGTSRWPKPWRNPAPSASSAAAIPRRPSRPPA